MARKAPRNPVLATLRGASQNEARAVAFLEAQRWGDEPACPRCGSVNVYAMKGRDREREKHYRWRCRDCKRMYSVRTGLVLEESRLPLRIWVYAFWKACASKKGASALQISRDCEISYKSALFLMHRIRYAMDRGPNGPRLRGVVEADETYIGDKPRYARRWPNTPRTFRRTNKALVLAMVQRGGEVRVRKLERVSKDTLLPATWEAIDHQNTTIMTDELGMYSGVGEGVSSGHKKIKHKRRQYVRGDVSTNTVESFFAILKRGIYGTFHSVSKHHLHRYLAEFEFRYNHRHVDDGERTLAAMRGAEGKRLVYAG